MLAKTQPRPRKSDLLASTSLPKPRAADIFSFRPIHTFKETHAQDFARRSLPLHAVAAGLLCTRRSPMRQITRCSLRPDACQPDRGLRCFWHDHLGRLLLFHEAPEWRHRD